jgi:hypothetical protein
MFIVRVLPFDERRMILTSTMIPSYKRPALLIGAIDSFRKTATNPDQHEAIVRLSEKDPQAERTQKALHAMFDNCQVIIGKQMGGYVALGLYYTEMLPLVNGEWINIWDDDMTIEGVGWDEKLKKAPHRSMVVCERYQLGPNIYDPGSLDGSGTGWFFHYKTWQEVGEKEVGYPPDGYGVNLSRRLSWPAHRLEGTILNHQWQRPKDGDR